MNSWRYLLLALPSAGLLGPLGLAWALGKVNWKRGAALVLLALPLWFLSFWQPYLWGAFLWLVGSIALTIWAGDGLDKPRFWLKGIVLVAGQIMLIYGLILFSLALLFPDQYQFRVGLEQLWPIATGMCVVGLGLIEWMLYLWRIRSARG